jgi:hypothetical protein
VADRVLVVPDGFIVRSAHKARALEYSRRVRESLGYDRSDVKVIFNDDDVSLTKGYIEQAFAVFQGVFRRPSHVHGEGMVVTGQAEAVVTWDWPVIASEDLVFGRLATDHAAGGAAAGRCSHSSLPVCVAWRCCLAVFLAGTAYTDGRAGCGTYSRIHVAHRARRCSDVDLRAGLSKGHAAPTAIAGEQPQPSASAPRLQDLAERRIATFGPRIELGHCVDIIEAGRQVVDARILPVQGGCAR